MKRNLTLALLLTSAIIAPQFASAESIKIGVLATFEGPFTVLGEDGLRGAMVAIAEAGGKCHGLFGVGSMFDQSNIHR